ncbi:MAG: NAD(P)H-dependent glycerol-3-phosphate dehydrogenase [Chloroflexi bacterium]|nr:MAG: NAD(P)H-dependent glycerol-3-phosphate dehydrogenase [Chloroflexota bacterium]
MTEIIAVVGAGNMGTAVAQVLASNGHTVRAWSIETDVLEEMRDQQANTKYLEGVELHPGIEAVWDLEKAVAGSDVIVLSVPSQIVAGMARDLSPLLRPEQIVLNVAKGLESGTNCRLSEVISRELGTKTRPAVGSMGGPAIAIETARGMTTAVIVAFEDENSARRVQGLLQNEWVKVDTTTDLCGLELSSTLKNVYAIALGVCDGMGLGANTKAFVGTLAMDEMGRICEALGGRHATVHGLAGLGDLLTTGYSKHSRNRTIGEMLGSGDDWRRFRDEKTVEGVVACGAINQLMSESGLDLPLLGTIDAILCERAAAPVAMGEFFGEFRYR